MHFQPFLYYKKCARLKEVIRPVWFRILLILTFQVCKLLLWLVFAINLGCIIICTIVFNYLVHIVLLNSNSSTSAFNSFWAKYFFNVCWKLQNQCCPNTWRWWFRYFDSCLRVHFSILSSADTRNLRSLLCCYTTTTAKGCAMYL